MKISYERVDTLILISGIDEYIRPVIIGAYLAVFSRDTLERAAAGSSDGKTRPPFSFVSFMSFAVVSGSI